MLVLKKRIEQEGESLCKESAEPAVLNMYEAFLKETVDVNKWHLEKARCVVRETDADFIRTFDIKKEASGKIVELRCPESKAVSIFGKNQTVTVLVENNSQEFNVKEPYLFTLRCFDSSSSELNPSTRLNFIYQGTWGISRGWRACYGDLQGYVFPEGMFLFGDDILVLEVLNTGIDIERIELSLEADIFEIQHN